MDLSSQDQSENGADGHNPQSAYLYKYKKHDLSHIGKVCGRVLDYKTRDTDGGGRCEDRIYVTDLPALRHLGDKQDCRTKNYSNGESEQHLFGNFVLCPGRE